jgi:PAS domain S-box-containing protein
MTGIPFNQQVPIAPENLPNLLIVDDNEENLLLLEAVVSKINVNLILALSGSDALDKIKGIDLALAILDVRMPGMSGYELALKINAERLDDKVPVIFITAIDIDESNEFQGYGSGAVDYMYKPFSHFTLQSKIQVFIDLFNQKQTIIRNATILQKTSDELVLVNANLQQSEAKYRSYIENAPDGVFVADNNGKYIEVNQAACQITGYSKEELLKMSVADLLLDDRKNTDLTQFDELIQTGTLKIDLPYKHQSGTNHWWTLEGVKLSETRFLCFAKDITRRVELEESLRAQQIDLEIQNGEVKLARKLAEIVSHKYTQLYDFGPSGYFSLSAEKSIKGLNHSGARMLGKDREHLKGCRFDSFISMDTLPVFNSFFQNILKRRIKLTCEIKIETEDNVSRNVHLEGIFDESIEQCLINVIDISERVKAEVALKEISTRLKLATRAGGVGVWDLDFENNKLIWDDQMFLLYGVHKQDVDYTYDYWLTGVHPEDKARSEVEILQAIKGEKEFDTEFRVIWPDGSVHNIRAIAIVIRNRQGNPDHMIGTNWEITQQKILEEKLKSSETNFRSFFETMTDMVVVGNMQGEIIYVNNSLCSTLGYDEAELLRMQVLELNPPEFQTEAQEILKEMLTGKRDFCPLPVVRKNGTHIPVETRVWLDKWNGKDCIFGYIKNLSKEQEALQKFNKIFQSNPALIAITTIPEGVFTDVNDAFLTKTGYSREELIGKTAEELGLFIESDKQKLASVELAKTGRLNNLELEIKTKSGKILNGLFSGEIIESQGNQFFLTVMIDVSERKLAEDILRSSESNLAEAQRIARIGSFDWDMISNKVKWSKEMFRVFDIDPETFEGHPESLLKIVHPDDILLFNNSMNVNYATGRSPSLEYRIIHRDGSVHNIFASGKIEFDKAGKPIRNIGTVQDITEQKKVLQDLKISEEKYRTMLNASPDGILLIDLKKSITEVSEIGLGLFDSEKREEMIGEDFYQFIPEDEIDTINDIFEKTVSEGLVQNVELKIRKKNQSTFFSEISSTLIQAPDGEPLAFMIIIRDITQRKKMETKQIHADRMANLGEMASGIAHEINQPLNIISMVMDKILFEADKKETINIEFLKTKSDKIFDNITRIRNIIDHVRAFSRSDNNYLLTAFDINASIENAVSMIMEQFKHLDINLNTQLDSQIQQIVGNTYKFEQVIVNLLTNAKDAVLEKRNKQDDYCELIIEIISYQENQSLIVEIVDNGNGIDKEDIHNIMLPFYTTKDEGKGTGLGLSICYQIIKEMNGTIDISSDGKNGTKIRLILNIQKPN